MSITQYSPNGRYSSDYEGSYDEWVYRTARSLAERYAAGDWGLGIDGANTAVAALGLGLPELSDYGSGYVSEATYDFFANYVSRNGAGDAGVSSRYGSAPTRRATYGTDPNSPAALNPTREDLLAENEKNRQLERDRIAADERISAADNAARIRAAEIDANARIESVRMQVESDWKIATLRDATDRYIAEGNWGVQKYIAELQEKGAMDRLQLELGMREQELAQRALEAKQQHHANMVSLALEVAKFDAQLAASPRNWIAYASWLKQRDIVVNGLNLAAAADIVDPQVAAQALAADPEAQASGVAGVGSQTQITFDKQSQTSAADLASGQSGGAATPGGAQQGVQEAANPFAGQGGEYDPNNPFVVGGVDLNGTDYAAMARQLMGLEPGQTTEPDVEAMQAQWDQMTGQGRTPGFSAWTGPKKNALGMEIEGGGHKYNYSQFSDLLPTKQEMVVGGVESVRGSGGSADWGKELERSRPKGYTASGAAGLG